MAKIIDPGKKNKSVKIKVQKVGPAPDKSKDGVELHHQHGKRTKTYVPADVRTGHTEYGKESKTKPTPGFVKEAQAQKKDIVVKDGKPYRAGHTQHMKQPDKIGIKIKVTPDIRPVKMTHHTEEDQTKGKEKMKQNFGKGPKRRLERVKWLKGRNKRTESGFGG